MSDQKNSTIFFQEWLPLINSLPDTSRLKFYDIIFHPDLRNTQIDDPHLKGVIDYILSKILENEQKYERKVQALKEAGAKGGKQRVANSSEAKGGLAIQAENENVNVKEKKDNPPPPKLEIKIPEGVPENFREFLNTRKKLKAQNTPHAVDLLLKDLEKLRQQGHDPTAVINQSIKNSWKGLFKLKEDYETTGRNNQNTSRNGDGKPSLSEQLGREIAAVGAKYAVSDKL